jgi:hypothetical protein
VTEAEQDKRAKIIGLMLGGGRYLDWGPAPGSPEDDVFSATMGRVAHDDDVTGLEVSRWGPPEFRARLRELAPEVL